MNIIFVDDSVPFDGFSPNSQPLGPAEKAFAHLPVALAKRGHAVRVFNRCAFPVIVHGAGWHPLERAGNPERTDILVAYRKASLLGFVERAEKRFLWLAGPAGYLEKPKTRALLDSYKPMLILHGLEHQATMPASAMTLRTGLVPLGVSDAFVRAEAMAPANPPRAVVTTHPLMGLDWLLELWESRIHPEVPWGELHIFSASLDRGINGADLPEQYAPILERCRALEKHGVVIRRPLPDPDMAEVYRTSRVHLYPGQADEVYCGTLAESQAVGLPAVARPLGATLERIENGRTGFLAPDDEAFANLAVRLLEDDETFESLSRNARAQQRKWTWDKVAAEFENIFA